MFFYLACNKLINELEHLGHPTKYILASTNILLILLLSGLTQVMPVLINTLVIYILRMLKAQVGDSILS